MILHEYGNIQVLHQNVKILAGSKWGMSDHAGKKRIQHKKEAENSSRNAGINLDKLKVFPLLKIRRRSKSVKQGMEFQSYIKTCSGRKAKSKEIFDISLFQRQIRDVTLTWCIIKLSDVKSAGALLKLVKIAYTE